MQDFVVGFIDPNEPEEIKPPAPKSDDDEESYRYRPGSRRGQGARQGHAPPAQRGHETLRSTAQGQEDRQESRANCRPVDGTEAGTEAIRPAGAKPARHRVDYPQPGTHDHADLRARRRHAAQGLPLELPEERNRLSLDRQAHSRQAQALVDAREAQGRHPARQRKLMALRS